MKNTKAIPIEETMEEQSLTWEEWDARTNWLIRLAGHHQKFRECDPEKRVEMAAKLLSYGRAKDGALKTSIATAKEVFSLAGKRLDAALAAKPERFSNELPGSTKGDGE